MGSCSPATTKHSSLARGGAPLVGHLEIEAQATFGHAACWWAPVARSRTEVGPGLLVVVARLDPDARFAFRVDLPADVGDEAGVPLGQLSAISDDAAFPATPTPCLSPTALAACPGWVREDVWNELESALERAGVAEEVRERAFADRHNLMERS